MRITLKTWITIVITMIVVGLPLLYLTIYLEQYRAKRIFKRVENNDKLFVYEAYLGGLNAAMYVDDLKDTSKLIEFYNKLDRRDTVTAFINFKIRFMPITFYEPIYVYRYLNKGSKIVELIDFNTKCWGYMKGYVYKGVTHLKPPAASLIKRYEQSVAMESQDPQRLKIKNIAKKVSPYGWYCTE
jgi:hypothetical protein